MWYAYLADAVVVFHVAVMAFVVGLLRYLGLPHQ